MATAARPVAGVVVALADEARPLSPQLRRLKLKAGDVLPIGDNLLLALSGIGPERATRAADRLLDRGVTALASWGTAGGLEPHLPRGALVLPKRVIDGNGNSHAVDASWRWRLEQALGARLTLASGPLLSSARALISREQKAEAFARTGAIAVDMESAAVANCAAAAGCPFIVARTITDTAAEALPQAALAAVDADGHFQPAQLLLALLRRPTDLSALLRLGRHFSLARQTLQQAALSAPGLLAFDSDSTN